MQMGIIEIIINIIFSTGAMVGFFYIYKKTHLIMALLAGTLSYVEMIFRTFLNTYPTAMQGIDLLMIPELIIMIYFTVYIWREGFKWLPIMILILFTGYLLLMSVGHIFYGEIGVGFMLMLMVWVSQSKRPCSINPWECKECNTCK
jgi:hypothetical protein